MNRATPGERLAAALQRHHAHLVWALFCLGLLAWLAMPLLAKKCYLDENALLVGGAHPTVRPLGSVDTALAAHRQLIQEPGPLDLTELARAAAAKVAPDLAFHHHNVTFASRTASWRCATLHTVVRAPASDGSEGLVLWVTAGDGTARDGGGAPSARAPPAALAAAVGVAAARHLQSVTWLAKDVVVAFADRDSTPGGHRDGGGNASTNTTRRGPPCDPLAVAQAWLGVYNSGRQLFGFPRAGALQQALVLEMPGADVRCAELRLHGWQGLVPNLDFYYLIKRNLDIHTGLPARVDPSAASPAWLAAAAAAAAPALPGARRAAPRWAAELAAGAAFAAQVGAAEPNGAHGAFLELGVDSATLRLDDGSEAGSPAAEAAAPSQARLVAAAAQALTAVEMERLHHSVALYMLLSPTRFISIAEYLAPPALLLAAAVGQTLLEARHACRAPAAAWRPAWLRVAGVHALAFVAGLTWHRLARGPRTEEATAAAQPLVLQAGAIVVAAAAIAWSLQL
eukprot:scaffold1.g5205.t1